MTKKTKISLNSSLIDLVTEQFLDIGGFEREKMDNIRKQSNECDIRKARALKLARKIVGLKFKGWTESDTDFYDEWATQPVGYPGGCTRWTKTMNEYIEHVEDGEPGMCHNPLHCILPVAAVGALFLSGPLGWGGALALSIGLEAIDATIYWSEGEEETAGLVLGLAVLPLVGKIVKRFPFVKAWTKGSPTYIRFVNGKAISVLEYYQIQALKANKKFIEKEMLDFAATQAAKESIELAGKKVTKETLEEAMKKGYMDITIDGVTHEITKDVFNGLTKAGMYTAKQQSRLIKFIDIAAPYVIAGMGYMKIVDEIAKTGVMGPIDLIKRLWGIEPSDVADIKVNKLFMKVVDPEAVLPEFNSNWDFTKFIFNSSGSAKDGELMVQAIKAGWNPFEDGKSVVPTKYRTEGYKKWVNTILNNKGLVEWFDSDGSEIDNDLLLLWVFDNPDYEEGKSIDEKYHTETRKKRHKKEKEELKNRETDDQGDIRLKLPDGTYMGDN